MTEHVAATFLPDTLPENPMTILAAWLDEARAAKLQPNSNAMTLATCDEHGRLSARIVLCKGLDVSAGSIDFYTNYGSRKARDIASRDRVALVFHWDHMGRQVRIEGRAVKLPDDQNDAYFATRPRLSQMGAWSSDQSQSIADREALLKQFDDRNARFADPDVAIPRPPNWGGFRVTANAVELWVEGAGRVHDRARFERALTKTAGKFINETWFGERLQP
ncbi:MAG: pyridoxamine 5'-phosphate oxidase [Pseudomonadota bacterium]